MKYVTEERLQKEIENRKKYNGGKEPDLLSLINFYCHGAITTVNNEIYKYLEDDSYLTFNLYNWKHDCPMWEIKDNETNEEVFVFESFAELVK